LDCSFSWRWPRARQNFLGTIDPAMTDNSVFDKAALAWCERRQKTIAPASEERLALGCTVFGDLHVERFVRYCLPSLMAQGNIESLSKPMLIIHTDEKHQEQVSAAVCRIHSHVNVLVSVIPAQVMSAATHAERFALVSAATMIQIAKARAAGAAFHLLVPDHVYAQGFFRNLMRLAGEGHQAIIGGGLSADVDEIGPSLTSSAEPADLNALAFRHLHPQFRALINNGHDDFPYSTLYLYVGEREACVVSPHMAPLFLSPAVIARAEINPLLAIDAQLPDLIGDGSTIVPTPEDGIVYIELSGSEKGHNAPHMRWSPWDYCVNFYRLTNHDRRWLAYLAHPTWLAFPPDYRPAIEPLMTKAEIEEKVATNLQMLDGGYGDKTQIYDPTDVLEPPYLGAMFLDPENTVFYQARGLTPDSWRFVPPEDLVGSFWKVYDFFVGVPPDDPQDPMAHSRHKDAGLVRETMELNGIAVLDFGGERWRTVDGTDVYLVKLQMRRFDDTIMFAGFASAKPRPAQVSYGTGFFLWRGVLAFGDRSYSVKRDEFVGLRIEIKDGSAKGFLNDELFGEMPGGATKYPVVAIFHHGAGPRPVVPDYAGAVNRAQNAEELP
jgi:hypothetical protein